jgi:hypothetical protein
VADIVLAEHRGQTWLVSGERYIDDLLANTLPRDVSIEFVACESESDVTVLWVQNCGQPTDSGAPWMIHPAIAKRIRRASEGHAVYFGQWSAMLDEDAHSVIRSAVIWAQEFAEADVTLVTYVSDDGPKAVADIANIRCSLIEAELVGAGIASERIKRANRDAAALAGMGAESQRVDIVIKSEK